MIRFFQVVFLVAAIVMIVLNIIKYNKYTEGKKEGHTPHPIKWFDFILSSIVSLGCALNIVITWINKS